MKDVNVLLNNGVNVQQSLELLGDMEMYDETLSDFLDMSNDKINDLNKYQAANDMPNYAIAVHALKSDARYLGFLELGDLAYDSELKAKAGDSDGVNANHPTIMAEVQKMIETASTYLGRSVAATVAPEAQAPQAETVQPAPQSQVMEQPVVQAAPVQQPVQMQQPLPAMQPQMQAMPAPQVAMPQPAPMQQVQYQAPAVPAQQLVQFPLYDTMTGQPLQLQPGQFIYNPYTGQPMQVPAAGVQTPAQALDPMTQALYAQGGMGVQPQAMPQMLTPKEGTILVVDDSSLVANFVKKIFNAKYDVVIANDGAKAIELCADDAFRAKIKACLLDLNMPNVDGYQVLEDFYGKGYFVKMPIAVISGVEDMESIDKVNKYPIIDILAKPFNERDVERVVEKCLAAYF